MKKYTYVEICELWFKEEVVAKSKTSTMTIYDNCLKKHILPALGAMDLERITSEVLQEFFVGLACKGVNARTGGQLSNTTISLIYTVVAATLGFAMNRYYLCDNPIKRVKRPAREYQEKRVLTRDEQSKIERAVKYSFEYRCIGILLSLYTGMRIGEVCALRWDDIDFVSEVINVNNTVSRVKNFESEDDIDDAKTVNMVRSAKTKKSIRTIPIPAFLLQKLKILRMSNYGEYVVNNKDCNKPMCTRLMTYIFKRITDIAGVDGANFHCLRHTFATRALENGMDIKTTSEILGHSNFNITMTIYTHSVIEHKREMMCRIRPISDELFGSVEEHPMQQELKVAKREPTVKYGQAV